LDKLLIIGSSGLVGSKIAALSNEYGFEAYNATHSRKTSLPRALQMDITDHDATLSLVRQVQPSVIINTAAITNVDYCETHAEEAQRLNVIGVRNLAEASTENKSRLVQISTDYVFDGASGHYTEDDTPKPLNLYGRTKLEAEGIVSTLQSYAIARPSVIYGWNPPETTGTPSDSLKPMNFAMFVADKLKKNEPVKAVRDQYSSPTFADNLAEAILKLARFHGNGAFHTAGKTCMSRYEFAIKLAQLFDYPRSLVQPVYSSDFKQAAQRPKNSCLKVDKAEHALGMRFMTAEEGIKEMRRQASSTATLPA
jgi:dTDP-4-dehydrorhamnose reductase